MLAATAERNAFCFSFWLISLISTFAVTGGCASRPPFACGTFAAREPFLIRGTCDEPRPLPQPTAEEQMPANGYVAVRLPPGALECHHCLLDQIGAVIFGEHGREFDILCDSAFK